MAGGDDFRQVTFGRPALPTARGWNDVLATVRALKGGQHDLAADLRQPWPSTGIVYVKNDSGSPRDRFDVLGIDAPLILPADNLGEFQRRVALSGVTPGLTHLGRFVVLLDALPDGVIGRAVVSGVVPGRVLVSPTLSFDFADVIDGDAAKLQLAAGGSAQVLWRDPAVTDGVADAVFRLGNPTAGVSGTVVNVLTNFCPATGKAEYTPVEVLAVVGAPFCVTDPTDCCPSDDCPCPGAPATWTLKTLSGVVASNAIRYTSPCNWYWIDGYFANGQPRDYWQVNISNSGAITVLHHTINADGSGEHLDTYAGTFNGDCCAVQTVVNPVSGISYHLVPDCGGSGSGSGSGGGAGCCAGPCPAATLTGTVTDKAGCYSDAPDTITLDCVDAGGNHAWVSGSSSFCSGSGQFDITCPGGGPPVLTIAGAPPLSSGSFSPEAGWTCSPFSAVYHVDMGSGNTMTVTVVA